MLPFTKRPGRAGGSDDADVVTKDDVAAGAASPSARGASAPLAIPAGPRVRPQLSSVSDEMTNVMPSKSIGLALDSARAGSPRPAAGLPPPSSARAGHRSAPPSRPSTASRAGRFAAINDEEEDGRTAVRGAPKIVKRSPNSKKGTHTTVSPAAVVKAAESARASHGLRRTGERLMSPPPQDLLEDLSDLLRPADGRPERSNTLHMIDAGGSHGAHAISHGSIPPGSARPTSAPPAAMVGHTTNASGGYPSQSGGYASQSGGYASQSGGYAAQSGGYASQSGGYAAQSHGLALGGSAPGSMPAHFMVPHEPHSDGRIDPPGIAVTARTPVTGRSAGSWAVAVLAFGLFVSVGAFAAMRGTGPGFIEASASFVDPARAAGAAPASLAAPTAVAVASEPPTAAGVRPAAVSAGAVTPPVAAPAASIAAAVTAPAPTAVAPPPVAAPTVAAAAPAVPAAPVIVATPKPAPHWRSVVRAPEEPVAAPTNKPAPRVKPPTGGTKPSGEPGVDEEQKKALKALQESQLESTF